MREENAKMEELEALDGTQLFWESKVRFYTDGPGPLRFHVPAGTEFLLGNGFRFAGGKTHTFQGTCLNGVLRGAR